MTKFSEFNEPTRTSHIRLIEELWDFYRDMHAQGFDRIFGYIFVLNSGALLATLTYVATKNANDCIKASIWLFAVGIVSCIAHATIDYYVAEFTFSKYRKTVRAVYQDEIEWETYIEYVNHEDRKIEILLHLLGWTAGIAFLIGLFMGITQIPSVSA
jgi:hypothetical protein